MLHLITCHGRIMPRLAELLFLFLDKNICCGYSLEASQQGTSNGYPQHMFSSRNKKIIYLIPTLI